jgi:uncharacterized protein YybS (DUF2232 family)
MKESGLYPDGKTVVWIVAGGVTSAIFFFTSIFVPLVGSFIGILAPLPVLILSLRRGWSAGILTSLAATLIVGFALKPMVALYFFVQFAMLALVASYLIENRATFGVTMLLSAVIVASGFFLLIGWQASSMHLGFFETLKKPIQENVQVVLQNYPGLSGEEAKEMQAMFQKMLSLLIVLVPTLIVIGSWLILLVNLYLLDRLHFVLGRKVLKAYDLNVWRVPDHFIWFVILPGFGVFLLHGTYRIVALNILIAALTVYFFQGFCIINFYLAKKDVPPFIKILIYFTLFVIQIVAVMVVVLGLLDMWIDFRKIFHKKPEEPPPPEAHPGGEDIE